MAGIRRWSNLMALVVMCLLYSGVALGDATSIAVTVGPNADKGVGYGTFEGAKILTLTIQPQEGYKIVSSECTDNAGENLWYRVSASDSAHVWKTFGVLPNFMASESHAAKFHGTLAPTTVTQGTGGPSASIVFGVKVSDVDIDVDALGRHVDAVWTPTNPSTEAELNDIEDKCEAGGSGGLAMPVTDAVDTLPATRNVDTGKVLRVSINAKWDAGKTGSLVFTGTGTKLAVYRQSGGQQSKVTDSIEVSSSGLNETFYIHTATGFTAGNIEAVLTPPDASSTAKDTVRIYPATDGYQLFVNTPATTDDYVPVEACGRVPVTVTREPSTAAVDLKLKDANATNAVQFYDAETGGTGVAEKTFTMAAGTSSKTFWVSGAAAGLGERTIKLFEKNGENWDEKKALEVTVVKIALVVNPDASTPAQNLIPIASSQGPASTRNTPEGYKDNSGVFYIPMKLTLEGPASARNVQLRATGILFANNDAGSTPYPEGGASVTPGEEGVTVRLIGVSPSASADAGTLIKAGIADVQLCKKKAVVFGITSASFRGSGQQGQALTEGTTAKFSDHPILGHMQDKVGLFIYNGYGGVERSHVANQCESAFTLAPVTVPNVLWDIKRDLSGRHWRNGTPVSTKGATGWEDDDAGNDDEDHSKLLQIDAPGMSGLPWTAGDTYSHKAKAREWVEVMIGARWYPVSAYLYWRSVAHTKYDGPVTKWVRDNTKANEVVEGSIGGFAGTWAEN